MLMVAFLLKLIKHLNRLNWTSLVVFSYFCCDCPVVIHFVCIIVCFLARLHARTNVNDNDWLFIFYKCKLLIRAFIKYQQCILLQRFIDHWLLSFYVSLKMSHGNWYKYCSHKLKLHFFDLLWICCTKSCEFAVQQLYSKSTAFQPIAQLVVQQIHHKSTTNRTTGVLAIVSICCRLRLQPHYTHDCSS
jgi:hypothetical protein